MSVFKSLTEEKFMEKADPLALVCALPEGERAERRIEIQALLQKRAAVQLHPDGVELAWDFSEEIARVRFLRAHLLQEFQLRTRVCATANPSYSADAGIRRAG
jgi:hypothetical protein